MGGIWLRLRRPGSTLGDSGSREYGLVKGETLSQRLVGPTTNARYQDTRLQDSKATALQAYRPQSSTESTRLQATRLQTRPGVKIQSRCLGEGKKPIPGGYDKLQPTRVASVRGFKIARPQESVLERITWPTELQAASLQTSRRRKI